MHGRLEWKKFCSIFSRQIYECIGSRDAWAQTVDAEMGANTERWMQMEAVLLQTAVDA